MADRALTDAERAQLRETLVATFRLNTQAHALWLLQHDLDDSDYRHEVVETVVGSLPEELQEHARELIYGDGARGFALHLVAEVAITVGGETIRVRYQRR
jgi:hypothetical protein